MTAAFNAIADRLRENLDVPVVSEVEGDVSKKLQLNVAQQKAAALVSFAGLTPVKQSLDNFLGRADVEVTLYERPVVNRAEPNAQHLLDFAEQTRRALTFFVPEGAASPLFYKRTSPIRENEADGGAVISCSVFFDFRTV